MTKPDPVRDEDGALRELVRGRRPAVVAWTPRPPSSRRAGLRTRASSRPRCHRAAIGTCGRFRLEPAVIAKIGRPSMCSCFPMRPRQSSLPNRACPPRPTFISLGGSRGDPNVRPSQLALIRLRPGNPASLSFRHGGPELEAADSLAVGYVPRSPPLPLDCFIGAAAFLADSAGPRVAGGSQMPATSPLRVIRHV